MNISEGILILATFTGPIAAVQAQKWIERHREKRRSKDAIFRTLMATRAARVSAEHVEALNMVDLEFYGGGAKEKRVRESWKQYLDHLNSPYNEGSMATWNMRQLELFIELLYQMGRCLGYDLDKTHIKNSFYSPVAHGDLEKDQDLIRRALVKILTGNTSIPVTLIPRSLADEETHAEVQKLLLENLSGKRPYLVKITSDQPETDLQSLAPQPTHKVMPAPSTERNG